MIPKIHTEKIHPEKTRPQEAEPEDVSDVSQPSVSELGSIPATRYAFEEPTHEVREQVSQQVPEQMPEPAPASPSHLLHLGLLGLVIVVVATVLGYLVGPMIEKRISPEASSQGSFFKEVNAPGPPSPLPLQTSPHRTPPLQPPHSP